MSSVIVLLHGLGRTHRSMGRLRRRLEAEGHETWSMTYPSRRGTMASISDRISERIDRDLGDRPLIAVTHSMGGIILRHLAERHDWQGSVLLAPPNSGSKAARWAGRTPILRWFFGPALGQLADPEAWPSLPSPNLVIAGTRGLSWSSPPSWCFALARIFKSGEAHDGTVSVTETSHHDVDEHRQVHAGHSTIMGNQEVIELVVDWVGRHA
ncbi:MAG: lysophospholipase [Phycisphaerales bacterium]|nr:lysophospholipase [Phycisphaerales bacterium]